MERFLQDCMKEEHIGMEMRRSHGLGLCVGFVCQDFVCGLRAKKAKSVLIKDNFEFVVAAKLFYFVVVAWKAT